MRFLTWSNELGRKWYTRSRPTPGRYPASRAPRRPSPHTPSSPAARSRFERLSRVLDFVNNPLMYSMLMVAAFFSLLGFTGSMVLCGLFLMVHDFGSGSVFGIGAAMFIGCYYVIVCRWLP